MKILLDLDGVLVNFVQGVIDWYKLPFKHNDVDSYDAIHKKSGLGMSEFWAGLTNEFWMNLKLYPWAKDILDMLNGYNVALMSAPARNRASEKQEWIRQNLPDFYYQKRYFLGPGKHFFADHQTILIDDSNKQVSAFRLAGGRAFLFPQPWNKECGDVDNRIKGLKYYIDIQFGR